MPGRAGRNRSRDPYHYWNNVASTKPEAQSLAISLGLDFPTSQSDGFKGGLVYPIRRLITTGEDNPTNFASLLGPLWETKAGDIIKETRMTVLLCPPPGSPYHKASQHLDVGSPRWTPRGPSAEEEEKLGQVRDMQQRFASQLGGRQDVESNDIKDTLTSMGPNWADNLGALEAAVKSTNQGVGR